MLSQTKSNNTCSLSICTVDMQLSAELKTLQMHRDELVDTIRDSVSLSQSLCSDGILTQPVFGDKDQISTKEKNSLILNAVEARAINVPQVYHVFIGILKKDQSLNTCTAKMATTCEFLFTVNVWNSNK